MLMVMRLEDVSRYCNGDGGNAGTHSNSNYLLGTDGMLSTMILSAMRSTETHEYEYH